MAFSKPITTRGSQGSYLRVVAYRMDDNEQELSATFNLYVDKDHSDRCKPSVPPEQRDRPLVESVAYLRVYGSAYADMFGGVAMTEAAQKGGIDIRAAIYDCAKSVCQGRKKKGIDDPFSHVISDFGPDVFADAKAV